MITRIRRYVGNTTPTLVTTSSASSTNNADIDFPVVLISLFLQWSLLSVPPSNVFFDWLCQLFVIVLLFLLCGCCYAFEDTPLGELIWLHLVRQEIQHCEDYYERLSLLVVPLSNAIQWHSYLGLGKWGECGWLGWVKWYWRSNQKTGKVILWQWTKRHSELINVKGLRDYWV